MAYTCTLSKIIIERNFNASKTGSNIPFYPRTFGPFCIGKYLKRDILLMFATVDIMTTVNKQFVLFARLAHDSQTT